MPSRSRSLFGVVFVVALVVYLPRTSRSLAAFGDSAELLTAAALWGVPHPPGYPLYTALTHVFAELPWLELPFSVHLTSALFRAATVAMVALSVESLTDSRLAAVVGAGTLGLGRDFFASALYAEVFPLADWLFATTLFLGIRIARGERLPDASPPFRSFALALGFSLAHHPMAVLSVPALAILVEGSLRRHVAIHPSAAAPLLALVLFPIVASYALLPLAASRHPYLSWGDVHDFRSFLALISRKDYGGPFQPSRGPAEGQLLERLDALIGTTTTSFGIVGSLLAGVGAAMAWTRERRVAAALVAAAVVCGPVFAAMNAIDLHSPYRLAFFGRFATMCQVPVAILVGRGFASVTGRLTDARFRAIAAPALAVATVAPLLPNLGALDLSRDRLGIAYAHDLVLSTPDDSLLLLKGDMPGQAALYLCAVERACGHRIIFSPGQLFMSWKVDELTRRYPGISFGPTNEGWQKPVRRLVDREMNRRPVFVHPELLDDIQEGAEAALPARLLFRLYANDEALRADVDRFRDEVAALARGESCEGCPVRRGSGHPLEAQLTQAYDGALTASITAARELGLATEADALAATMRDPSH